MAEANTKVSNGWNNSAIIIAVTIVVLAVIFMFFRDRQQKRQFQLERLNTQTDVLDEWGPQRQNTTNASGGKIL